MPIQLRNILKSFFNTGDRPTENQFSDLVDSFVHQSEDKASTAEIQAGTNNAKYVTPAGAKASVQTFAPVKTVNGQTPVSGNVSINTGGGNDVCSVEPAVLRYLHTPDSSTDIFHIKLPFNINVHQNMFHFKAEGFAYRSSDVIDIVWVGRCYKPQANLIYANTVVSKSSTITAGQYIGSDNYIYLWFKVPRTYYCSFKIDSMKVGNGIQVLPGQLEVIVSSQTQL
ncbi:hypothetical protein FUA48_14060 [Flavobacterium alkalisoli]|uniref:Uncharacterized protein n=1 Tax=Flavobacterium alkalisoli TaxID=2602769 RepID=A0A5B9FWS9_9FLAO|nr:hypothetical protein [Flavobacterium alkalisoli]QEE50661.1 hypothetical protein FUA48_14060 [Flavobacterium alkalisoli]